MFGRGTFALFADETPAKLVSVLKVDKEYDKRTVIKPSTIPSAGNGLFAFTSIKKGEIIGQLGGRLVTAEDYPRRQALPGFDSGMRLGGNPSVQISRQ